MIDIGKTIEVFFSLSLEILFVLTKCTLFVIQRKVKRLGIGV